MTQELSITYDIYVAAPATKVWQGIVNGDMTQQYVYGTRLESKLKKGAPYVYVGDGGFKAVDGEIIDVAPEKKLVMSWNARWDDAVSKDPASRVIYELTEMGPQTTKLRVTHDGFKSRTATFAGSADAWPLMMSSLKSLIETGKPIST
jgi:uncharacterized protein YndB with AHSA1/START domain